MIIFLIAEYLHRIQSLRLFSKDYTEFTGRTTVKPDPLIDQFLSGKAINEPNEAPRFKIARLVAAFQIVKFFEDLYRNCHIMLLKGIERVVVLKNHGSV